MDVWLASTCPFIRCDACGPPWCHTAQQLEEASRLQLSLVTYWGLIMQEFFFFFYWQLFSAQDLFGHLKTPRKYMFDLIYFPEHINIVIALKSKTLTLGVVHDLLTKVASRTSHVYLGTVCIRHEGEFTKIWASYKVWPWFTGNKVTINILE